MGSKSNVWWVLTGIAFSHGTQRERDKSYSAVMGKGLRKKVFTLPFDSCGILAHKKKESPWEGIQPGKGTKTRKIRLVSVVGPAIGLLLCDVES